MELTGRVRLLHWAAQLEQIGREMWSWGTEEKELSMAANHALGVSVGAINFTAKKLTKMAAELK